jgi:dihydroorotate dehydrogenase (NAD+) catalytic subunit
VSVHFCDLELAHPVINASGTFDLLAAHAAFGESALRAEFPFAAFVSKTITLHPRAGNPPPRLFEAPAGLINSIGLPNKGLEGYLEHELPGIAALLTACGAPLITNVMGSSAGEIATLLERCDEREEIAAFELNVSCPNVETGLDIGADPIALERVVRAVRPATRKPLIVKLTPNAADVAACARAAESGGADAVSLINTLRAMALAPGPHNPAGSHDSAGPHDPAVPDTRSASPAAWLGGRTGGLSGPAIRAVALAQVAAVANSVAIPIVGMGGIQRASHARDLLDAGATLVAVGTESFRDPAAGARIASALA